ncbi:MAG: pirin family protein [Thioalkalivibrionaceae bacterium]
MSPRHVTHVLSPISQHWVGNGFPVHTLFAYDRDPEAVSPYLLFDHAGPAYFEPTIEQRGVGAHPHRGFETVTLAFAGAVAHRDSAGGGGIIQPGDVQWMTAGDGVIHEEFHDRDWAHSGGEFHMVQLWINLPRRHKRAPARYQHLGAERIPTHRDAANHRLRVIAGSLEGATGPAETFSRVLLADLTLLPKATKTIAVNDADHSPRDNLLVAVLAGDVSLPTPTGPQTVAANHVAVTSPGDRLDLMAGIQGAHVLLLGGEPIREPVVGRGPFVMNHAAELAEAFADYRAGRLGHPPSYS